MTALAPTMGPLVTVALATLLALLGVVAIRRIGATDGLRLN